MTDNNQSNIKSKSKSKSKSKNKLIVFKNLDKEGWHESWHEGRDLLNFPFPCRILVSANPNSGKTNMIKNILIKAKPFYKRIYLCHYDLTTKEYDDIDIIKLSSIPNPTEKYFNPKYKSALIIDDMEFKFMNRDQLKRLDRLWGYASTHRGLTLICATQDFYNLPPVIRRMSDVFFIWKGSSDMTSLSSIGRKFGLNKDEFVKIINNCKNKYDQICFDRTSNSPAKYRLNGYDVLFKDASDPSELFLNSKDSKDNNSDPSKNPIKRMLHQEKGFKEVLRLPKATKKKKNK